MKSYTGFTDAELISYLNQDDQYAFTEIYRRYWDKIYVIARNRLGNSMDAEEIVQNIFLNLWRKRSTFELTTQFPNYFAVAAKFEVMDLMRKQASVFEYVKDFKKKFSELDMQTQQEIEFSDFKEQMQSIITALPDKCQMVIKLKYNEGLSQKEIAAQLNISEKTVEAHLAKGRKILQQSLMDYNIQILVCCLYFFRD